VIDGKGYSGRSTLEVFENSMDSSMKLFDSRTKFILEEYEVFQDLNLFH